MSDTSTHSRAFVRYAWIFLGYLILVILFGAWVRITHSGAGCGDHWPTCHGEFIPFEPTTETIIEYTHRLTSGVLGPLALLLVGWAYKLFGAKHRVFWAAIVTTAFVVFEALIGAGIVLAELVEDDDSVARAVIIAIHLVNTLTLSGAAAMCAWWSTGARMPAWRGAQKSWKWLFALALAGLVFTSMSGAVTALGDTLFPVDPTLGEGLFSRVRSDLSATNHFLVRLRIIHPVVAVLTTFFLVVVTSIVRTSTARPSAQRWALWLLGMLVAQLAIGAANIYLGAPGWMQIVHLLMAQAVWIAALITANETLQITTPRSSGSPDTAPPTSPRR